MYLYELLIKGGLTPDNVLLAFGRYTDMDLDTGFYFYPYFFLVDIVKGEKVIRHAFKV